MCKSNDTHWALYAKSVLDRTRLALTNKAESYQKILQPSAEYLGSLLGVESWAVCLFLIYLIFYFVPLFSLENVLLQVEIFTEEIIRAGSAASLSTLLNRLDPELRKTANLGRWNLSCLFNLSSLFHLQYDIIRLLNCHVIHYLVVDSGLVATF